MSGSLGRSEGYTVAGRSPRQPRRVRGVGVEEPLVAGVEIAHQHVEHGLGVVHPAAALVVDVQRVMTERNCVLRHAAGVVQVPERAGDRYPGAQLTLTMPVLQSLPMLRAEPQLVHPVPASHKPVKSEPATGRLQHSIDSVRVRHQEVQGVPVPAVVLLHSTSFLAEVTAAVSQCISTSRPVVTSDRSSVASGK